MTDLHIVQYFMNAFARKDSVRRKSSRISFQLRLQRHWGAKVSRRHENRRIWIASEALIAIPEICISVCSCLANYWNGTDKFLFLHENQAGVLQEFDDRVHEADRFGPIHDPMVKG